jgi:CubicO group peptidase (beta-lactamase class C family)
MCFATDTRDLIRRLRHLPMTAEPRTKFQYTNIMFATAGYIIKTLTGSSLGAFFHSHLWEPMGLNETFLGLWDPALKSSGLLLADEYYYKRSTDEYLRIEHLDMSIDEAAGAVISNVLDYAKYLRTMINEAGPISKAGHRELKAARSFYGQDSPPFVGPTTYTLGWMSGIFQGEQIWMHSGQVIGTTWMLMVPSKKIGIAVMTNSSSKSMTLVLYRILYDIFGVKMEDRFDFLAKYGSPSPSYCS